MPRLITAYTDIQSTPMFKVYKSSAQSISTNTWTKVTFDSVFTNGDPLGEFDLTNERYQPSVAGFYQFIFNCSLQGSGGTLRYTAIVKNSSYMAYTELYSNTNIRSSLSSLIHMNGSTDTVEFQAYTQATSGTPQIRGNSNETQAQGFLVRAD